mgnify:CR=1 FL=1
MMKPALMMKEEATKEVTHRDLQEEMRRQLEEAKEEMKKAAEASRKEMRDEFDNMTCAAKKAVSYTHLTLPTNREV